MESDNKNGLTELRELIRFYVESDIEDTETEQKAKIDLTTTKRKAELVRDFLSLANPPQPNYADDAHLIVGCKNGRFLVDSVEDLPEESDVRGILDSYVYPPLDFGYHQFEYEVEGEQKRVGVFRIARTGEIHEVNKEMREGKDRHLAPGESWARRGSTKTPMTPEQKHQLRPLLSKHAEISRTPVLKVHFHTSPPSDVMEAIRCEEVVGPYLKEKWQSVQDLYQAIKETVIPTEEESRLGPQTQPDLLSLLESIRIKPDQHTLEQIQKVKADMDREIAGLTESTRSPVTIEDRTKKAILMYLRELFDEEPGHDLFDLGNLKESFSISSALGGGTLLHGKQQEKNKHEMIHQLEKALPELAGLEDVLTIFRQCLVIPLALVNEGNTYDEDIRVNLHLPAGVRVLHPEDFPTPTGEACRDLIREGSIIESMLNPTGTPEVIVEGRTIEGVQDWYPNPNPNPMLGSRIRKSNEYLQHDFRDYFEDALGHPTNHVGEETVVEFTFDYLKHNEAVSFGPYLVIEAESTFDISYVIKSKHHPEVIEGSITYLIE